MKSYVEDHMKKSLSEHSLDIDKKDIVRMGRPNTCVYSAYIAIVANRICITGDVCLGANDQGIVSSPGYGLGWFSGHLSESYLCEKFLRQEWQWDAAVESIQWQIRMATEEAESSLGESWWLERVDKLQKFIASPGWKYDVPTGEEFYEFMTDLGSDGCELPGYDYPRIQAGWLCAIQQRYVELTKETSDE